MGSIIKFFVFLLGLVGLSASKKKKAEVKKIDKKVKEWADSERIVWHEFQGNGVIRGVKNRKDWVKKWYTYMHTSQIVVDWSAVKTVRPEMDVFSPSYFKELDINANIQRGGEKRAQELLTSFVDVRSKEYMYHISKPSQSRNSCSRLSPHLAWGSVSVRQVYQAAYEAKEKGNKRNLNAFLSRLRWPFSLPGFYVPRFFPAILSVRFTQRYFMFYLAVRCSLQSVRA